MKKVLLDENLPRQLKQLFTSGLKVTSVPDLGWQSKKNGEPLAALAESGFDVLLTADKNLRFQQNVATYGIKIVVLLVHDTRKKSLETFVPEIEKRMVEWDATGDFLEINLRS